MSKRPKTEITITVDVEVKDALDERVEGLNKEVKLVSRSSLANYALRKQLSLEVSDKIEDLMELDEK